MKFSEFVKKCKTGYPASIPIIVAHIQKYLFDNPIPSKDTVGEIITEYIEENPSVVPVMTGATSDDDGAIGLAPQPLAGDQAKVLYGDGSWKNIPTPDPPDVMEGATSEADGESGLVPQPLAGDQTKVLYGDGSWKNIPTPDPPDVMEGATSEADGESGLVPQPLIGDQTKVLYGDGSWKNIPTPDPPDVMEGATSEADGESGLVPQPLAGDQTKVLYGDGTWKNIPTPEPPVIPVMEGATSLTNGESGLVPQPLAGDQTKVLYGDGSWNKPEDDVRISVALTDWSDGSSAWPDNVIPIGLGSVSTCYLATISADLDSVPIKSAVGDIFNLIDYNKNRCIADLYVYAGNNCLYVATTIIPSGSISIRGVILHTNETTMKYPTLLTNSGEYYQKGETLVLGVNRWFIGFEGTTGGGGNFTLVMPKKYHSETSLTHNLTVVLIRSNGNDMSNPSVGTVSKSSGCNTLNIQLLHTANSGASKQPYAAQMSGTISFS